MRLLNCGENYVVRRIVKILHLRWKTGLKRNVFVPALAHMLGAELPFAAGER